jgi:integrating conjugative element protein (TIGR03759 family)
MCHVLRTRAAIVTLALLSIPTIDNHAAQPVQTENRRTPQVKTRMVTTEQEKTRFDRSQWKLSQEEWIRYQKLMKGIRGSISPANLSPIEVLGVHARSEQERKKYARQWARMRRDDAERILAFQRAYDAAWKELDPSGTIIDIARLKTPPERKAIDRGDRVLLFLRLRECDECQILLTRVRRAAFEANAQLDIYFIDTKENKDDAAILAWAKRQQFDPERIKQRAVTFNHDKGTLIRIGGITSTVPAVFRIRGDRMEQLDASTSGL